MATKDEAPTPSSPFTFPTSPLPPPPQYSPSAVPKLILFPQLGPHSTFLSAYSPALLRHGITSSTFTSFLTTISAFLTATISDRALSHAADMAADISRAPTQWGRDVALHARSVRTDIRDNARRRNVLGVVANAVEGAIFVPVAAVFSAVGTLLSIPPSVIGAVVRKPKKPMERAAAYAAVANDKWFHQRGLHAQLFDTDQVAQLMGLTGEQLLRAVGEVKSPRARGQLDALKPHIEELEIQGDPELHLESRSLWLVIIPWGVSSPSDTI